MSLKFLAYGQEVNLKLYRLGGLTDWSNITIKEAGDLVKLAKEKLPQNVKQIYSLKYREQDDKVQSQIDNLIASITDEQRIKRLPEFYGDCLSLVSDIKPEVLAQMNSIERTIMYRNYIEVPLMGLLNMPDYEYQNIKSFDFEGVTYYLPEYEDGYGVTVPMAGVKAIEFIESADIELRASNMAKGRWDQAALLISILCRPKIKGKREAYDEKICRGRAKIFEGLAMNVAIDVFFCFTELLTTSESIGQTYVKEVEEKLVDGLLNLDGRHEPFQ